ncbi:MAG TPA: hypothetical protein VN825_11950, partial [Candidatus Acidoferrum sp.]|nr:hypothetical protein [Candidatus Acidoferrum sp.]
MARRQIISKKTVHGFWPKLPDLWPNTIASHKDTLASQLLQTKQNPMEKLMIKNALKTFRFVRLALMAGVGFPFILASNAFAQLAAPAVPAEPGAPPPSTAEVERVVVTGSN